MSTTLSRPATPAAFRITASGVSHRLESRAGVDQPPSHVAFAGPNVGGGVAGSAGGVGGGLETVIELGGSGLGIASVDVPPPSWTHEDATAARDREHRKTMILLTGGLRIDVEALGGYRPDGRRTPGPPPAAALPPPVPRAISDGRCGRRVVRLHRGKDRPP